MTENRQLVRCKNCKHESGMGFDAWCALGLSRHDINNAIYCDAFKKWDYDNSNEYKEIEIVDGNQLILWKHDNSGQKFTHTEFIKFLNEKCNGCYDERMKALKDELELYKQYVDFVPRNSSDFDE